MPHFTLVCFEIFDSIINRVTSMNDSPAMDLLNSQMSSAPDSNFNVSKPSPSTPSNDAETLEDEDVLPPSPVPAGAHPRYLISLVIHLIFFIQCVLYK